MTRDEWVAMLRDDRSGSRRAAIRYLAKRIVESFDHRDLVSYWQDIHTGDSILQPLHSLTDAELESVADESIEDNWY